MKSEEHPFFENFRTKIANGELEEALNDIRAFLNANEIGTSRFDTEADLLRGRYKWLTNDQRQGLISPDDARRQKIQIAFSASEFVKELQQKYKMRMPAPTPEPANSFPDEMPAAAYEKLIGMESNLKSIAWLEMGIEKAKSVCRILTEDSYGSGFLTEGGWLWTNHHVLPKMESCQNCEVQFNYNLDFSGNPKRHFSYTLDASTFETNQALDFSRVKINDDGEKPLATWGFLEFNRTPPKEGKHVTIIQHPDGGRKQIALNENRVLGFYKDFIHYATDTQPGSSGSPVFDDDWTVIGIHHVGGGVRKNDAGEIRYANEAILATPILQAIGL